MALPAARARLLRMQALDLQVRSELMAQGRLHGGYHPRMAQVHAANAQRLRTLIQRHGWPTESLVGAEAAWLVAQHAIAEPAFMRRCRSLLDAASRRGEVPRWQFAYLDDRIRVAEGGRQRFGTQVELRPEGAFPHALEDPQRVDAWRQEAGLGRLEAHLAGFDAAPLPEPMDFAAQQQAERAWRRQVGWTSKPPAAA